MGLYYDSYTCLERPSGIARSSAAGQSEAGRSHQYGRSSLEGQMNPFSEMMTETVYLEDKEGNRSGPFRSAVAVDQKSGRRSAPIFDESIQVEAGFKLVRQLP